MKEFIFRGVRLKSEDQEIAWFNRFGQRKQEAQEKRLNTMRINRERMLNRLNLNISNSNQQRSQTLNNANQQSQTGVQPVASNLNHAEINTNNRTNNISNRNGDTLDNIQPFSNQLNPIHLPSLRINNRNLNFANSSTPARHLQNQVTTRLASTSRTDLLNNQQQQYPSTSRTTDNAILLNSENENQMQINDNTIGEQNNMNDQFRNDSNSFNVVSPIDESNYQNVGSNFNTTETTFSENANPTGLTNLIENLPFNDATLNNSENQAFTSNDANNASQQTRRAVKNPNKRSKNN